MKKIIFTMFPVLILSLFVGLNTASAQSAPFITISASPTSVAYGGTTTISWTAASATACTGTSSPSVLGWNNNSKSNTGGYFYSGTLNTTTTFTLNCTNAYGSMTKSVIVNVSGQGGGGQGSTPSITLSAFPTTVNAGGTTTLNWSVINGATSCIATSSPSAIGWNNNSKSTNGGYFYSSALSSTTTFVLTCSNQYGTSTKSITVNVNTIVNPPTVYPPVVTVYANPSVINAGSSSNISWFATNNPSTCTIAGWYGNMGAPSGSKVVYPTNTTTYTVTCTNSAGAGSGSATVTVNTIVNPPQNPTVNINANPTNVQYNGSSIISWSSTNTTSCNATGGSSGWAGTKSTSGTYPANNLTNPQTVFSITCYGTNGQQVNDSVIVYAMSLPPQNPTVNIYANPSYVAYGGTSNIVWNSTNATSCIANGGAPGWYGTQNTSGNFTASNLTNTTTFSITCYGSGNPATATTTVSVGNQPYNPPAQVPTVSLIASPSFVSYNGTTNLTWNVQNATSCNATQGTGAWVGPKNPNGGNFQTGPLTYNKTFKITCYGNTGLYASDAVTVVVGSKPVVIPTVSITADQSYVSYNGYTYIRWSTTGSPTYCSGTGGTNGWAGSKAVGGGSFFTSQLTNTGTYTYSISCGNNSGQDDASVTITVGSKPASDITVVTNSATNISTRNATLRGLVNPNNNNFVNAWFEWGTNGNYGNQTNPNYYTGNSSTNYSYVLGGLNPNTTYTYRAVAQSDNGQMVYGEQMYFTTQNEYTGCTYNCGGGNYYSQPSVTTYGASSIGDTYGTLNGYVDPNGTYTTRWFEWGTNSGNLYNTTNKISQGTSAGNFNQQIYGLNNNTTYYYRAVAQNSAGVMYGNVQTFVTTGNNNYNTCLYGNCAPTVSTTLATNIDSNSARLNGIAFINGNIATDGYFEWGTNTSLGRTTNLGYIGSLTSSPFYSSLFGLTPNTTYYYRAVASNQYGTVRGDIVSFRTGNATTTTVTNTNTIIYRDRIVTTNTDINLNTGISKPSLVYLSVNRGGNIYGNINGSIDNGIGGIVRRGETVEYTAYYKNVSNEQLRDVVLRVALPKELEFLSTTRGYLSEENNTVVLNIGNLYPQEEGSITVRVRVNSDVESGKIVVVTGNVPYTYTVIKNNIATNTQEEVFAYAKDTVEGGEVLGLQGIALFGNGFWPSTLIGWLILLIIILLIILLARTIYNKMNKPNPVVVNTPPNNINHYH